MILLDTNILLTAAQSQAVRHQEVVQKITDLIDAGELLCVVPQNLYEYYAVATRPIEVGGFDLSQEAALKEIHLLTEAYLVLPEHEATLSVWLELINEYDIRGKATHDARLAACMRAHGLHRLYTLNIKDFRRFSDWIEFIR